MTKFDSMASREAHDPGATYDFSSDLQNLVRFAEEMAEGVRREGGASVGPTERMELDALRDEIRMARRLRRDEPEREYNFREALHVAQKISYVSGQRRSLQIAMPTIPPKALTGSPDSMARRTGHVSPRKLSSPSR